jgi:N-acetylglucosaminyldiphosphoundecaprenol N-acetyl-beta-D-mannosaminyltransferase
MNTRYFLGVRVDNTDGKRAMEMIQEFVVDRNGGPPRKVFFINVHTIHLARKDQRYRSIINTADIVLPDGSGLAIAGRLLGKPIRENLNGTDFTPKILARAAECGWTVYLFGGSQRVTNGCLIHLAKRFPLLNIVGSCHGHLKPEEERITIADINGKYPDVLLVALGSPLQEEWIARYTDELRAGVCFAVGGLFDFLSGECKRAPLWMRRLGLEWIFRFIQDPGSKWNRIVIEVPVFLFSLLVERLRMNRRHETSAGMTQ